MQTKEKIPSTQDLAAQRQLEKSLDLISRSSIEALRDVDYLMNILSPCNVTTSNPIQVAHFTSHPYLNLIAAEELAYALIDLSHYDIHSMREVTMPIGCASALIYSYLERFNKGMKQQPSYATDPVDLLFFSTPTPYEEVRVLYNQHSQKAKICLLHHVMDRYELENFSLKPNPNEHGSVRLWDEIKRESKDHSRIFEYAFPSPHQLAKGLGVRILDNLNG